MKRLFTVNGTHFESKEDAKVFRDEMFVAHNQKYPVHLGPDHWRYGLKGNARTHSHKMNSGSGDGFPKAKKAKRSNYKVR